MSDQDGINWAGVDIRRLQYEQGSDVFRQGDEGTSVLYVERGTMRLSVVSAAGNEAVVLGPDAFGEGCSGPKTLRHPVAVTPCIVSRSETGERRQLWTNAAFARRFLFHVLTRNVRIQGTVDYLTPTTS